MLVFVNGKTAKKKTGPPAVRATPDGKNKRPTMKRTAHHRLDVILNQLMARSEEQAP
jgi:hypothetical protein